MNDETAAIDVTTYHRRKGIWGELAMAKYYLTPEEDYNSTSTFAVLQPASKYLLLTIPTYADTNVNH